MVYRLSGSCCFFCVDTPHLPSVFCGATLSSFSRSFLTLTLCARAFCGFDTQQVLTRVLWRWQFTAAFGRFRGVDTQATSLGRFLPLTFCSFLRSSVALPPSYCCRAFCSPDVDVNVWWLWHCEMRLCYWKWSCPESCHFAPCHVLPFQRHFFLTLQPLNIMHHELCPCSYLVPSVIPSSPSALHVGCNSCAWYMPLHFLRTFWKRYSAMASILRDTHPVPINCLMSYKKFRPVGWVHCILRSKTTHPRCSSCNWSRHSSSCFYSTVEIIKCSMYSQLFL